MRCSIGAHQRQAGAIRPLDVAAVLCVVAWLAFCGVIGAARARQAALKTRCRANLVQIGTALELYGKENGGRLPVAVGGVWPWDINTNLTAYLQTKGVERQMFYCPANPEMNDDRHWNFGQNRVIGYGMLFRGMAMVPSRFWQTKLPEQKDASAAKTELAFDATACVGDDYTMIQGAYRDRSNHMRGKRPLGGNILFLDQHAEWRDFNAMQMRFNTIGSAGQVAWSF